MLFNDNWNRNMCWQTDHHLLAKGPTLHSWARQLKKEHPTVSAVRQFFLWGSSGISISVSISLQTGGLMCFFAFLSGRGYHFYSQLRGGKDLEDAGYLCLLATPGIRLKLSGISSGFGYFLSLLFIDCLQFPQWKTCILHSFQVYLAFQVL